MYKKSQQREHDSEVEEERNFVHPSPRAMEPYHRDSYACQEPAIKKSISFFSSRDLLNFRAIPVLGASAYLFTSLGAVAADETFVKWFGSEYRSAQVQNWLTLGSLAGIGCYVYGRRHIRHAGSFQRLIYPLFTSTFFLSASHLSWGYIRSIMNNQECFDYHTKIVAGLASGVLFLCTGKSYLLFIDHW